MSIFLLLAPCIGLSIEITIRHQQQCDWKGSESSRKSRDTMLGCLQLWQGDTSENTGITPFSQYHLMPCKCGSITWVDQYMDWFWNFQVMSHQWCLLLLTSVLYVLVGMFSHHVLVFMFHGQSFLFYQRCWFLGVLSGFHAVSYS